MANVLKNIAIIGASGNLGTKTLEALLKSGHHNITVITRPASTATYPSPVTVKRGQYDDNAFLESALQGQDVLIVMLAFAGIQSEAPILDAAAKAGVKYVFPSDYGADLSIKGTSFAIKLIEMKKKTYEHVQSLGMKWIVVVTNPWTDYCLEQGVFGISIPERKAEVYTDSAPFNTTTTSKVGAAIAACLALPEKTIDEKFSNGCLYVSSFRVTQPELFQAVMRVSGTTESEWSVEKKTTHDLIQDGQKMVEGGDAAGNFKVLFGGLFQRDNGGDYTEKLHNDVLGLEEEDLDEVVRESIANAKTGRWDVGSTLVA